MCVYSAMEMSLQVFAWIPLHLALSFERNGHFRVRNLYHDGRKTGASIKRGGREGEFGLGIKWMALLAEEQKCRLPLLLSLSLSLSLNGSIIEGQWERDSDLEFSGVTGAFLNLEWRGEETTIKLNSFIVEGEHTSLSVNNYVSNVAKYSPFETQFQERPPTPERRLIKIERTSY